MAEASAPTVVEIDGRRLKLTNLDKVLYPATETTKGEVLNYYARIAPRLLPQLAHRPVTRVRFPHGVADLQFFEKNMPGGSPAWIEAAQVDDVRYPLVDSVAALSYFVNLASLEFHTPQWRVEGGAPVNPDRLVIDLDEGGRVTALEQIGAGASHEAAEARGDRVRVRVDPADAVELAEEPAAVAA